MPSVPDRSRRLLDTSSYAGSGSDFFTVSSTLPAGEELSTAPLPVVTDRFDCVQADLRPGEGQLVPLSPALTRQLEDPGVTRVLTGTLPANAEGAVARGPVVIKGEMRKRVAPPLSARSHRRRRLLVSLSGVLILVMVTALALLTVSPLGRDIGLNFNFQPATNSLVAGNHSSLNLIAQATATAVYHQQNDGYGGGSAQLVGNGTGSLNWPVGECTYWANYRYHQLTGFWIPWSGNANQWVAGARSAGWNVSTSPHVPSIIVLMGVQGANSYYGHVAVVESIVAGVSPVTVHTSNMNWYADGGGWNRVSYANFTVGYGVYFVWHS